MTWKTVLSSDGVIEWFNPDSRLRIQLSRRESSFKVFVYRKRLAPPKSGSAPTFHLNFNNRDDALSFVKHLLVVKNLNFNYLNSWANREYERKLSWLYGLFREFSIHTAGFVTDGPNIYLMDGVRLKFELRSEPVLGAVHLHIIPLDYPSLEKDTFFFFRNQHPLKDMVLQKDWFVDRFDKLLRKVYWTVTSINIVQEVVAERTTPNYGGLPKGFRVSDRLEHRVKDNDVRRIVKK